MDYSKWNSSSQTNRTAAVAQLTFTKLQFVEDGSFTGGIKTNHKDSHLLLAELYCNERSINTTANTWVFIILIFGRNDRWLKLRIISTENTVGLGWLKTLPTLPDRAKANRPPLPNQRSAYQAFKYSRKCHTHLGKLFCCRCYRLILAFQLFCVQWLRLWEKYQFTFVDETAKQNSVTIIACF